MTSKAKGDCVITQCWPCPKVHQSVSVYPWKSRSLLTRRRGRCRQWRWSGWGCGRRPPGAGTSPGTRCSLRWVDKSETHLCRLGVWRHGRLLWVSASNFFFCCKIARNCWVHVKKLWHAFQVPHSDSKGKVYYLQLWVLGGKVAILFVVWASLPGLKQNQYKKFLMCGQADHSLPFPWGGNQSFSSENLAMLVFCKAEKCLQCR